MSRRVVVLCEDRQQEVFIRQWLRSLGIHERAIDIVAIPAGQGSGAAHVRQKYPEEVKALRQVNSYREIGRALVTAIDADQFLVSERHAELDKKLGEAESPLRQSNEPIALLVPKRNIETWIHYLQGVAVDEVTIYPKLFKPGECKRNVKQFVEREVLGDTDNLAPESLQIAVTEMKRIR
jgi:hypothetical protein